MSDKKKLKSLLSRCSDIDDIIYSVAKGQYQIIYTDNMKSPFGRRQTILEFLEDIEDVRGKAFGICPECNEFYYLETNGLCRDCK